MPALEGREHEEGTALEGARRQLAELRVVLDLAAVDAEALGFLPGAVSARSASRSPGPGVRGPERRTLLAAEAASDQRGAARPGLTHVPRALRVLLTSHVDLAVLT